MFDKESADQISNILLSNDTICQRISAISEDIVKIIKKNKEFAFYQMKVPIFLVNLN